MMHGYSVQDAASVLGVPEGRVWELLARGVLNGTPEGDSMRVFLKADAPAEARPAPREELPRSNGNGGSHPAEASAFRELLTEFRNLTERYGQALLALGEARGEVAGLRSRVEQLEARIDLRLPARVEAEPIAWEAPTPRAPAPEAPAPEAPAPEAPAPEAPAPEAPDPEPPAPAEVEAMLPTPAPIEPTSRPRKARSTRAAIAGFAEALARAQDPTLADVGEVIAPAELEAEAPTGEAGEADEADEAEALEPAMAEMAEPTLAPEPQVVAEEAAEPELPVEATYRAMEIEPDWFADGDFSWLDAADLEARRQAEASAEQAATATAPVAFEADVATEPVPELLAAVDAPIPPEVVAEAAPELEPIAIEEAAPPPTPEPFDEVELPSLPEAVAEAVPQVAAVPVAPQMEPVEMSDAGEEAVMWLGGSPEPLTDSSEPADEMEVASVGLYPGPRLAPRIRAALEQVAWPSADRRTGTVLAIAPTQPAPAPLAMTEEELAQLARDEGWDDAEVAAIRAMISRPAPTTVELPGSAELDEAISALQAVPIAPRSAPAPGSQWAKPATGDEEPTIRDDWAFEVEPQSAAAAQPSFAPRRTAPDPDWVSRRRGPAATAYRRIRRIFTG